MDIDRITRGYLDSLELEPAAPTLALLADIAHRHVARHCFASIGPRLSDPLPLDPAALYARIVLRRRGGYCFEHNGLVYEVLRNLGYSVQIQLARVLNNRDVQPGLTHRTTLVEVAGRRWLIDVGFGALGPNLPVPLDGTRCARAGRCFWIAAGHPGEWLVQTLKDGAPYTLYRYDLARYSQADCELGHFYSHRHPDATFVNHLVASRIEDDRIYALRNRMHLMTDADGVHSTEISSSGHLHALLTGIYNLEVSVDECKRLYG